MRNTSSIASILLLLLAPGVAKSQVQFVDVSSAAGIEPYVKGTGFGAGVAAADFDDDGDVDFFVPNAGAGAEDRLYRNLGDGTFDEIGAAAGVASTHRGRLGLWLDYDGDHRLDLLVAGDCYLVSLECPSARSLRLFRQVADAQFVDTTAAAGLEGVMPLVADQHIGGAAAAT